MTLQELQTMGMNVMMVPAQTPGPSDTLADGRQWQSLSQDEQKAFMVQNGWRAGNGSTDPLAPRYMMQVGGVWKETSPQELQKVGVDTSSIPQGQLSGPVGGSTQEGGGLQSLISSAQQQAAAKANPAVSGTPNVPPTGQVNNGNPVPGQAWNGTGSGGATGLPQTPPIVPATTPSTPQTPPIGQNTPSQPLPGTPFTGPGSGGATGFASSMGASPSTTVQAPQTPPTLGGSATANMKEAAPFGMANLQRGPGQGGTATPPSSSGQVQTASVNTPPPVVGTGGSAPSILQPGQTKISPQGMQTQTATATPQTSIGSAYSTTSQPFTPPNQDKGMARNLSAEQAFVKQWGGKGGRLPTANEINQAVYGTTNPQFNLPQGAGGAPGTVQAPTSPQGTTSPSGTSSDTSSSNVSISSTSTGTPNTPPSSTGLPSDIPSQKELDLQAQITQLESTLNPTSAENLAITKDVGMAPAAQGYQAQQAEATQSKLAPLYAQLSQLQTARENTYQSQIAALGLEKPFTAGGGAFQLDAKTGQYAPVSGYSSPAQTRIAMTEIQNLQKDNPTLTMADIATQRPDLIQAAGYSGLDLGGNQQQESIISGWAKAYPEAGIVVGQDDFATAQAKVAPLAQAKLSKGLMPTTSTYTTPSGETGFYTSHPGVGVGAPTLPASSTPTVNVPKASPQVPPSQGGSTPPVGGAPGAQGKATLIKTGAPSKVVNLSDTAQIKDLFAQGYKVQPVGYQAKQAASTQVASKGAAPAPKQSFVAQRGPVAQAAKLSVPSSLIQKAQAALDAKSSYQKLQDKYNNQVSTGHMTAAKVTQALMAGEQKLDPILLPLKATLKQQMEGLSNTSRSFQNFDNGFTQLVNAFANKPINMSSGTWANMNLNEAAKSLTNAKDISAYQAGLQEVRTEYQQVVARGGQVDDKVRSAAEGILSGNQPISTLKAVKDELQAQGQIVIGGYKDQVTSLTQQINDSIQSGTGAAAGSASTTVSSDVGSYLDSLNLPK